MSNEILNRQNEQKPIMYLAAQRQLYSEAKRLNNLFFDISVLFPFLLSIMQFIFDENELLNVCIQLMSILVFIAGIKINSIIKKKKIDAAMIQQQFDVYVYDVPWDKKLFGKRLDMSQLIAEKSNLFLKKNCGNDKLKNWYTSVVGSVSKEKGILMCQKENFSWDISLRKKFKNICCIFIGIVISLIIAQALVEDDTLRVLISKIGLISSILEWIITVVLNLNNNIKNLNELGDLINDSNEKSIDDLMEIQSKIFNHRKSCYCIPDYFYKKYKNNDEYLAYRLAMLDKEK